MCKVSAVLVSGNLGRCVRLDIGWGLCSALATVCNIAHVGLGRQFLSWLGRIGAELGLGLFINVIFQPLVLAVCQLERLVDLFTELLDLIPKDLVLGLWRLSAKVACSLGSGLCPQSLELLQPATSLSEPAYARVTVIQKHDIITARANGANLFLVDEQPWTAVSDEVWQAGKWLDGQAGAHDYAEISLGRLVAVVEEGCRQLLAEEDNLGLDQAATVVLLATRRLHTLDVILHFVIGI